MSLQFPNQGINKPMPSRSVAIDVFKGWGVWFMFLIHAFVQQICQFDASLFLPTIQRTVGWKKVVLLIFGLPIGVMAIWGFMFGFAFACTVAMQMLRLIDTNPKKIPKYLFHKALTGFLIVLLNKIGHTLFRGKYFTGDGIIFPGLYASYSTDILDVIQDRKFQYMGFCILSNTIGLFCHSIFILFYPDCI